MSGKTSISNASNYHDIGAFWDEHDATEFGDQNEVEFAVNIESQRRYYPLERDLSFKVRKMAEERGISEETLLNLWIQEKISQTQVTEQSQSLTKNST